MNDLGIKIFSIILGVITVVSLQAVGVSKLTSSIFGGISSTTTENILKGEANKKYIAEMDFWNATNDCASVKCYKIYIEKYPKGMFIEIAKEKINIKTKIPYFPEENDSIKDDLLSSTPKKNEHGFKDNYFYDKVFYINIASTKDIKKAKKITDKYLKLGYISYVFKTTTGSYGITLAKFKRSNVKSIRKNLIEKNIITPDSYISTGNGFIKKIYP